MHLLARRFARLGLILGGECRLVFPGHEQVEVRDAAGAPVASARDARGHLVFPTVPGGVYHLQSVMK